MPSRPHSTFDYWGWNLLTAGGVFSACTQLRFGLPLGIGELILCAFIIRELLRWRSEGAWERLRTNRFVWFWLLSFAFMLIGWNVARHVNRESQADLRDAFSYVLAAFVSVTASLKLREDEVGRVGRILASWLAIPMAALVPIVFLMPSIGFAFMYGPRFKGLTDNPNQIAVMVVAAPFLVALTWRECQSRTRKLLAVTTMTCALILGMGCSSDALLLAWLLGFVILAIRPAQRVLRFAWGERIRVAAYNLMVVLAALAAMSVALVAPALADDPSAASNLFHHGFDASDREDLWNHAIEGLGVDYAFGLGPGAHSGYDRPYEDVESHSSYVEWATIAGVFGLAVFLWLLLTPLLRMWRDHNVEGVAFAFALLVLLAFHHALRHPIIWIDCAALYGFAAISRKSAAAPLHA